MNTIIEMKLFEKEIVLFFKYHNKYMYFVLDILYLFAY